MNKIGEYFKEINKPEEFTKDLNHESIRHATMLNKIAHKYGIKDTKLFLNDCATSTLAIIEMGYDKELLDLIDGYKDIR